MSVKQLQVRGREMETCWVRKKNSKEETEGKQRYKPGQKMIYNAKVRTNREEKIRAMRSK